MNLRINRWFVVIALSLSLLTVARTPAQGQVDAITASVVRPAQATPALAASQAQLSPAELKTRFRSMMASRNRRFRAPQTSPR